MQATENGLQHVNVKFFVKNADAVKASDAVGVFQKWIQEDAVDDLLIDVADYQHVPAGPGIILVGHHALYSLDNNEGRLGVLYNRRTAAEGSSRDLLKEAIEKARTFAQMLARDDAFKGRLEFADQELQIIVNDRRIASNTDETLAALKPDLEAALKGTLGEANYSFNRNHDARRRFTVNVTADRPFTV